MFKKYELREETFAPGWSHRIWDDSVHSQSIEYVDKVNMLVSHS